MRQHVTFPPEWRTVPLKCPKCPCTLLARFTPNNRTLEALRCPRCAWTKDYIAVAVARKARLAAARREFPASRDLQTRLDTKGDPPHAH